MIAGWPRGARLASWVVGTRALAWVAMVLGSHWPVKDDDLHWIGSDGGFFWDQVPYRWLDVWGRWDTMYYWHIARFGYPALRPDGGWVYTAAYYPLFPALMRGASVLLFGLDPFYCGLLVANAMLAGAVVYFDKLLRLDETPDFALLAVAGVMAYPGSHFLSCVYPESTALFLGVFAVYCARTSKPLAAGLACMLSVIARSTGGVVCVAVLYELLRADGGTLRLRPRVLALLLPALTVGLWLGLNYERYRDPLYFVRVQGAWGRRPTFPFEPLLSFDHTLDFHALALFGLGLVAYGFVRRERGGYRVMAAINALLPLSTGILNGIHRYTASNFPLFIFLARLQQSRPLFRRLYFGIGLVVLAIFSFRWGQGRWPN